MNINEKRIALFGVCMLVSVCSIFAQTLSHSRWDELTASDWPLALKNSNRTCILPIGILEKHGPHVPLGSDLIQVREWSARATKREYAVVFPDYFYGQINEAKHQPGIFALPERVVWDLLEATCDEIARNGFNKIVIINGHGGNPQMIRYFIQTRLEKQREYAVYFFEPPSDADYTKKMAALHKSNQAEDQHAGERETSALLYLRPDLVKMDSASNESGVNQKRLDIPNVYTAIWWYASYPNHYAGDGAKATRELGQLVTEHYIDSFVAALKAIKEDTKTLQLQKEFFDKVRK
ncbi:MAG TPA: creatininase family protein [Cyclobacteriaceae bacterium]|nr:creatininase family protein [Cyclobacteriaceae bacterium]